MALVVADRVQETTNTTGTGTLTLAGAVAGFQSFSVIGNANTTYYTIVSGTDWETGVGTYTSSGTTLSRDTVLASSASGSKITVVAGAFVFCSYPAGQSVYEDASGVVTGYPISGGTINNTVIGGTTPAAVTATSLNDSGNLTFTGTGNRITGDFSNATVANRVMFQSSTTNGITRISGIPNGSGTGTLFTAYGLSDPTNSPTLSFFQSASASAITAAITGTGTYTPLTFSTNGSERLRIFTSGGVSIGNTTDPGAANLSVTGAITSSSASIASASTITPTTGNNQYNVTALAVPATIAIPSGTPVDGQKLVIRIEDDGTARALTWTTSAGGYRVIGSTLPTTTVATKNLYVGCIYNSNDSFWDVVAVAQQV
jgi:hypothetical protein